MADLINDGSLVGFWPLHEASGAPFFKNYSPVTAKYPSGISFDMHVAIASDSISSILKEETNSIWPGTNQIFNQESGVWIQGYQVPGHWKLDTDSSPYSKYLVAGAGGRQQVEQFYGPAVAQSGFTVGVWVYPTTDGYLRANEDATGLSLGNRWEVAYARAHTLIGQFAPFNNNAGWMMGVSGRRERGAQFGHLDVAESLGAFVSMTKASNFQPDLMLETPIESGRYTHLTVSYRYIDGTNNQLVLYKDGRVTASGTTNDDLVLSNSLLISSSDSRPLTIGGSDGEIITKTNRYELTSGWNNFVSGVYYFRRVLHEGEILELHERGGLVVDESVVLPTAEVSLTDPDLVGYYPIMEQGFGDFSANHRPLISNRDLGYVTTGPIPLTGPFGYGCVYNDSTDDDITSVATSGTCYDLLSQGSWTIGLNVSQPHAASREAGLVFSWGSVTEVTSSLSLPISNTLIENSAGICCTVSGIAGQQRYVIEVYPDGSVSSTETLVFGIDGVKDYFNGATCHLSLAYDDSTFGVAAYLNGALQGSGTLSQSLTTQLDRVTGSGFPLMFGNGIEDALGNTVSTGSNRGVHNNAGQDSNFGQIFMVKRALVPDEIRAIALSGIDITRTHRSRQDARLVGYWPASSFKIDDIIVDDQALCWQEVPGNLIRGDTFAKQERWYDRGHDEANVFREDATAGYDQFASRTLPPELSSFGNLGMTSGTFVVHGGSVGTANVTQALQSRSSIGNLSSRYKPNFEQRDLIPQNTLGDFVLSYEVTPSGDIPATILGLNSTSTAPAFNSALHTYTSSLTAATTTRSFLTTLDAGSGSGVVVAWFGEDDTPLVSGSVPYGVPSKVLLHGRFMLPYNMNGFTAGSTPYEVSIWINGSLVNRREITAATARLWGTELPDSSTDVRSLGFGGVIGNPTSWTTQYTGLDSGLGDIYLREVFIMRGVFYGDEVESLAVSGIQTPTIAGFTNNQQTTQVSIANSDLVAYYRFNGFEGGGSGTTDLSLNNNHMFGAQESLANIDASKSTGGAHLLRAIPGPFAASDLAVQASGFTYSSLLPTNSTYHQMPPFMASGTRFNSPDANFSVGFFYIKKDDTAAGEFDAGIVYGVLPTTPSDTSTDIDYGWVIGMDEFENMKMTISLNDGSPGNMFLRPLSNSSQAGQKQIGAYGEGTPAFGFDVRAWDQHNRGSFRNIRADAWSHHCWVYDAAAKEVVYYSNGLLVDRKYLSDSQVPNTPSEFARYITFYQHTSAPWTPGANSTGDHDSVITDFFYFDNALTQAEVRYIAQNGIDSATGTETSGVVGGYMHGQDTGSGLIGGFSFGQDTGSGLLGGYMPGGILGSGAIGGFISGVVFGDGTLGGWVRGLDNVSGIMAGYVHGVDVGSGSIAGYIRGQEVGSGLFGGLILAGNVASGLFGGFINAAGSGSGQLGGFMLGGLQSNFEFDAGFSVSVLSAKDFDAQLEIAKTVASDFDAKVVIFQDEIPPLVDIIIPDVSVSGLAPPFNQYFVAKASGQQGKTIDSVRWTFGDMTPAETVAESGAGCYPVQHMYSASGFFIAKFEAIDSDGLHSSATRIISAVSGIDPVLISFSGVPRSGDTELIVDFDTDINILPPGVSISTQLLSFDDGQTTIAFNPTHSYTQPGTYKPIWCVRDSRGIIWCDSLEAGNDFLESGGRELL